MIYSQVEFKKKEKKTIRSYCPEGMALPHKTGQGSWKQLQRHEEGKGGNPTDRDHITTLPLPACGQMNKKPTRVLKT